MPGTVLRPRMPAWAGSDRNSKRSPNGPLRRRTTFRGSGASTAAMTSLKRYSPRTPRSASWTATRWWGSWTRRTSCGSSWPRRSRELDGHREWGVRLCLAKPEDKPKDHTGLTGTEYLLRRRERLAGVRRAQEDAARAVDRLHGRLLAHATRSVERSSGRHASAEHAYLVTVDREPLFHNEIDRLAGELAAGGITVERTGPWPPYSFVDIELEARAHA